MIEAYIYSACTSCRKTDQQLRESGVAYVTRDFFRERFTRDELETLLDRAGLSPRDILSKRSKAYQARGAEIDKLDNASLLNLMLLEPTLLRRPLVLGPSGTIVGHNATRLGQMIESTR